MTFPYSGNNQLRYSEQIIQGITKNQHIKMRCTMNKNAYSLPMRLLPLVFGFAGRTPS